MKIFRFPIAGLAERVYNGRFWRMLGTAACQMIMVFVGGGDQKRSLVCWLGGARLLGQQIKDEASGMSDWVLITHGQSL